MRPTPLRLVLPSCLGHLLTATTEFLLPSRESAAKAGLNADPAAEQSTSGEATLIPDREGATAVAT